MAVVVLFSTMSFTIDMHYCGNTLVETSAFKKSKGCCGMEMQMPSTNDCSIIKIDCCADEQQLVAGQDELQLRSEKLPMSPQLFASLFVYNYQALFEVTEKQPRSVNDYPPPIIVRQLFKLDESYLI